MKRLHPDTFVILLEREQIRVGHVQRMMELHAFPASIFPAVDGRKLGDAALRRLVDEGYLAPSYRELLSPGHLGCALSHVRLWEQMLARGLPEMLVVEDDFEPAPDFWRRFRRFHRELPADFDIAYLYLWNRGKFGTRPLPGHTAPGARVCLPNRALGTVGYLISQVGARCALEKILPLEDCIDDELDLLFQNGELRACASSENLILHHEPFSTTLLDADLRPFHWSTSEAEPCTS